MPTQHWADAIVLDLHPATLDAAELAHKSRFYQKKPKKQGTPG